jgi:CheY-specific phosphatase CheX
MSQTNTADPSVSVVIAKIVLDATQSTFSSICGGECQFRPSTNPDVPSAGVMGVISFVGDYAFSYALVLPQTTAETLAKKFAGFDIPFDSADMGDVVGELANVVAGDIVARFDGRGIHVQMSLPMVTRGHDVEILLPGNLPTLRIDFTSPEGGFWMKLVTARPGQIQQRRPGV